MAPNRHCRRGEQVRERERKEEEDKDIYSLDITNLSVQC